MIEIRRQPSGTWFATDPAFGVVSGSSEADVRTKFREAVIASVTAVVDASLEAAVVIGAPKPGDAE